MMKSKSRVRRVVAGIAIAAASFGAVSVGPAVPTANAAVTATVPNMFADHQQCSRLSGRCRYLGYWQENGAYNPSVPSRYIGWITYWTWSWI